MEDARIQLEKAAKNTDAEVEGEESIPKPSILKPSHPDEFVISTPTKEFEDTPMTPEGREASRSGDEEMGESFELVDRDRSPDGVRYTLAPGPTAASRDRSDAGIDCPAREVKKYRANTAARTEVESRTPARAHPRSLIDSPAEGSRMQSRARLSNELRGLLSRDDHVHTTGESPETKKARGDAQI